MVEHFITKRQRGRGSYHNYSIGHKGETRYIYYVKSGAWSVSPGSGCYRYNNECNQWGDVSQAIGLEGRHTGMETEVIWDVQCSCTPHTIHLKNYQQQ